MAQPDRDLELLLERFEHFPLAAYFNEGEGRMLAAEVVRLRAELEKKTRPRRKKTSP